jgi:peroxiredoxin Q/BCP
MLEVGMKAPEFTLAGKNGEKVSLSDFRGQKVVLYFYSKDNTSGCTKQACAFAQNHVTFEAQNVAVIGISKDSAESHAKFANKHQLPFILLSDPEREVHQAYNVLKEKKSGGKVTIGTVRTTYIIDEEGIIEHVMPKVKPDTNAEDVLAYLAEKAE